MKKRLSLMILYLFIVSSSFSQHKLGLALGGGGAKGIAHIGALKVIESMGIKIDYIAGTSIGAIVGGMYASGYKASELEQLFLTLDIEEIISGENALSKIRGILEDKGVKNFSDTRIPFKCVTYDLRNNKEVILSSGPISKAIRASMSVPIIYEPVDWNGISLVDGGMVNNFPVDVVRAMGADIVIAIDLSTDPYNTADWAIRAFGGDELIAWLETRPDISRYKQNRKDTDIYIHPSLYGYSPMSFNINKLQEMLSLGTSAAKRVRPELLRLKR